MPRANEDLATVEGFGDEWSRFDQSALSPREAEEAFMRYFAIFPWQSLPPNAEGFDLGCGSGRWALQVAPRVRRLHCIDASDSALAVAKRNLGKTENCSFHHASVDRIPLADGSMDFGYSLGVLHHVPDTAAGLSCCVAKLKAGAPFLVYLYYDLHNRPVWYRLLWRASDIVRRAVSRSPGAVRYAASQALAALVYFPLARAAALAERLGLPAHNMPLAYYRKSSYYTMRTDALDRFGTRLEQRFSKDQIQKMMVEAGLERIEFSPAMPFWVAVGFKTN